MHRACFVWELTSPLSGWSTPRPGPVRAFVCACSSWPCTAGRPPGVRFGAPHLSFGPFCLCPLFSPFRAWVARALVLFSLSSLSPLAPPSSSAFCVSRPWVPLALTLFVCSCPPPPCPPPTPPFLFPLSCFSCPVVLCAPVLAGCGVLLFPAWGAPGPGVARSPPPPLFFFCPAPPLQFVCVVPCVACCCGFLCCVLCCGCPPCVFVDCCALSGVFSGGFLWVVLCCAVLSVAVCCAAALIPLSRCVVRVVACFFALVCAATCCAVVKPVGTPVAIFGSLGVYIYEPASRDWLISYSPIHLT